MNHPSDKKSGKKSGMVVSGTPRALAQKLPADEKDLEEDDDDDVEVCQIKVCQKMIEDLQIKMFNIERNLYSQIETLRQKIDSSNEGRVWKRLTCLSVKPDHANLTMLFNLKQKMIYY